MIRRVFDIYVEQAAVLMPAAAAVFVFTGIVARVLIATSPGLGVVAIADRPRGRDAVHRDGGELVADIQDGRRDATAGQLLRAASPVLGQLILVGVVAAVGIIAGFILLVIPGLILLTLWSVSAPVVVIESPGVFPALRRSRLLVRGNGWQVFAVIIIMVVLVGAAGNIIDALAASAGTGAGIVARVVVGVLSAPLSALAAAVLYFELRARSAEPDPLLRRVSAFSTSELLRPGLLEGVSIMLARASAAARVRCAKGAAPESARATSRRD